jgi:hypothetical protein
MKTGTRRIFGALFLVAGLASARPAAASTCEDMMSLSRVGTTVTLAQPVDAEECASPSGRGRGPLFEVDQFLRVTNDEVRVAVHEMTVAAKAVVDAFYGPGTADTDDASIVCK